MAKSMVRTLILVSIFTLALIVGTATKADAQVFVGPLIGFSFSGDASCPKITNCEDKKPSFGVAVGNLGDLFAWDVEVTYTKNFFGTAPGLIDARMLTLSNNLMIAPQFGRLRPYALAGIGAIRLYSEIGEAVALRTRQTKASWDVGGGVMAFVSDSVGLRGDVKYFRTFRDLPVRGFVTSGPKMSFARASAELVLVF